RVVSPYRVHARRIRRRNPNCRLGTGVLFGQVGSPWRGICFRKGLRLELECRGKLRALIPADHSVGHVIAGDGPELEPVVRAATDQPDVLQLRMTLDDE